MKRIIFAFTILFSVFVSSLNSFATTIEIEVTGNRGIVTVTTTAHFDVDDEGNSGGVLTAVGGVNVSFPGSTGVIEGTIDTTAYVPGQSVTINATGRSYETNHTVTERYVFYPDNTPSIILTPDIWRGVTQVNAEYSLPSSAKATATIQLYRLYNTTWVLAGVFQTIPLSSGGENEGTTTLTFDSTLVASTTLHENDTLPLKADARIYYTYSGAYIGNAQVANLPVLEVHVVDPDPDGTIVNVILDYSFPSTSTSGYVHLFLNGTQIGQKTIQLNYSQETVGQYVVSYPKASLPPGQYHITADGTVRTYVCSKTFTFGRDHKLEAVLDNQTCVGEPINVANGNMHTSETDISVPAPGLPLTMRRMYNSRSDFDGMFGYGWRSTYEVRLDEAADGVVTEIDSDGVYTYYTPDGAGSYTPSSGKFSQLVKNMDDSFTITRKNGTVYEFDASGVLTQIEDRNGNYLALSYDLAGVLSQIAHSNGRALTFTSDGNGHVATITDPEGREVSYEYDANGDLESVTDPMDQTMYYGYDTKHNMTVEIDRLGTPSFWEYDDEDRATSNWQNGNVNRVDLDFVDDDTTIVTDSLGNETTYEFNEYGLVHTITDDDSNVEYIGWDDDMNKTYVTDKNGHTTEFDYDAYGNVVQITDPKSAVTSFTYDTQFNQVLTLTDPYLKVTTYTYDSNGNLLTVTDPLNNTTTHTYDSYGNVLTTEDSLGNVTLFMYDTYGNLTRITDALNNETEFTYDLVGNVLTITDALDNTTTLLYDDLNRNTSVTYPDSTSISFAYDNAGNKISATDAKLQTTLFVYDAFGRMLSVSNPLSETVSYTYDTEGNQLTQTDADTHITTYTYDNLLCLATETTHLNKTKTYTYDAVGNVVTLLDAEENEISYTYDECNHLTEIEYPDFSAVSFTYDLLGRKTSMVDSLGTTTYTYDDLGRLVSLDGPGTNDTITYTYDAAGNRTSMTDQDGNETEYAYDALNRLSCLTDSGANVTSFAYNELSRVTEIVYPNGAGVEYAYDVMGRVTNMTNTGTNMSSFAYQYDPNGMRTAAMHVGDAVITYEYDAVNRLIKEAKERVNIQDETVPRYVYEFAYDASGNRTQMRRMYSRTCFWDYYGDGLTGAAETFLNLNNYAEGSNESGLAFETEIKGTINRPIIETSYVYDADNRLTSLSEEMSYSGTLFQIKGIVSAYDDNGNLISETLTSGGSSQVKDYRYDYENRFTELEVDGVPAFSAVYDGEGRRVAVTEGGATSKCYYDGLSVILERNSSDVTSKLFTRIPGSAGGIGGIISMATPLDTDASKFDDEILFYHYDGIGNVANMSGANGVQNAKYIYDAFGNELQTSGAWTATNDYAFSTKEKDASGLVYYGARYYNPEIGRWTQRDPMGFVDGPNVYAFVGNNPVNYFDLWGYYGERTYRTWNLFFRTNELLNEKKEDREILLRHEFDHLRHYGDKSVERHLDIYKSDVTFLGQRIKVMNDYVETMQKKS
jgi:RHS repeat-associated protein